MNVIKLRLERYKDFSWYTIHHNANSSGHLRLALLKISNDFTIYSYNPNLALAAIKFDKSLVNKELNIFLKEVQS